MHRVSLEVFVGVQAEFLADVLLDLAADEVRHQNLVFERSDLEADLFIEHAIDDTGDFGDHGHLQVGSEKGDCPSILKAFFGSGSLWA